MKTKKVCFMSMYAYPLFNPRCKVTFGGAEVQLYNYATTLAKIPGYEVSFLVMDFGQDDVEMHQRVKVVKTFAMNKKRIFLRGLFYLAAFFRSLGKINADVYIQRAAGVETALVAWYCKARNKKFIYMTASSIDVDGTYIKNNPIWGQLYLSGIKMASSLITQNDEYQKLLKNNYRLKSTVIRNSFLIPVAKPDIFDKEYILWVGSAQKLKRPEIFLNLARKLPKYKFVMIMPKHNQDLWTKITTEAKYLTNFKMLESVPLKQIDKYYQQAKLFINTSTFEGFPNTFVQSAAAGTPIISLKVNPDRFLDTYKCGICCNNDTEYLYNSVRRLMKSKEVWRQMSDNIFAYALKNHNISSNLAQLINEF